MTAAVLGVLGVLLLGAAGRQALVTGRRCEVRWRLGRRPPGLPPRWSPRCCPRSWPGGRTGRRLAGGVSSPSCPHALDDVARALRAGASLRQAMADAARAAWPGPAVWPPPSWAPSWPGPSAGLALAAVLDEWADEQPLVEVRLAATALALAADAGGRAAQVVEAVAGTLRERHSAAEEVGVQSVQARLSAVVIALLPVGFTAWCVTTDRRAASFLLGSAAGWLCLLAGFGLLAVGAWWMARIMRSAA